MKITGSKKIALDADGFPWLIVGVGDNGEYEAWKLEVTERHLFDRSWQAIGYVARQRNDPSAGTARALPSPADAPLPVSEFDEPHKAYGAATMFGGAA